MKLVLTEKEQEYLLNWLDDGKQWGRDLNNPHRTLLEKVMAVKDVVDAGLAWGITIGTTEEE